MTKTAKIWKKTLTLAELNQLCAHCAVAHLGIEFTELGDDWLSARLPVDARTTQPFGLLHGGISAALAETVASAGAMLSCDAEQIPVGIELNISHLRPIKQGFATATARPVYLGRQQQVWQIDLHNDQQTPCASARLRVSLVERG